MKYQLLICALLLLAISPVSGQMTASHSPTGVVKESGGGNVQIQVTDRPVAKVNGVVLTDRDLLREMFTIFPYARQHNGFPRVMESDIRAGALRMIIFEELVYQEAERRKMTISPERMERAVADFRKQFHTPDEYQQFMRTEAKNSQRFLRAKIRRSLLIEAMLKLEVKDKSVVTLAQAKSFYDKNPDKFHTPESFSIQTISVLPPKNATPEQLKAGRKRAEDALRQAKMTKSYDEFGLLAEKISDDDYRVMMGDHKAVDRAQLPPTVVQAALAMQPGQVSELIQLGDAYSIFRMNGHIPPGKKKFEEVKDQLRKQLEQQKTEQLRASLSKRLRATAKVEEL
jgi:parvulin-like peptidyl-prolyl isomerase